MSTPFVNPFTNSGTAQPTTDPAPTPTPEPAPTPVVEPAAEVELISPEERAEDYLEKANTILKENDNLVSNIPISSPYWDLMNNYRRCLRK